MPERPSTPESVVREIKRKTRKRYNAEEKIRIVLEGLKGEASIAEICRREGINNGLDPKQHASYPMWRNDQSKWIVSSNAHPAIIAQELWQSVNKDRPDARRESERSMRVHSPYLLTGLMRCSECGFAFQGWSGQANGKLYQRYIDGGWKSKRVCSHLSIPKEEVRRIFRKEEAYHLVCAVCPVR